jgi:hypothetical protein
MLAVKEQAMYSMEAAVNQCKQENKDAEASFNYKNVSDICHKMTSEYDFLLYSGSYVMHGMIQQQMPTTQRCRVLWVLPIE